MVIVDRALAAREESGAPVRVAMTGAGFLGRALAKQMVRSIPGIRLVAIANRTIDRARQAYADAGMSEVTVVNTATQLDNAILKNQFCVTENPDAVCEASLVDAVIEATGNIEYGAKVALNAIGAGKHFIMNAELDATLGPILKRRGDRAGVVVSGLDGDQPGTEMNLYRFVKNMGLMPLLCGNIKALQDAYRTPSTQEAFAARWGMNPYLATSFADGSKISFEQASVGNATGMGVARRGMLGYVHNGHVDELTSRFDVEDLRNRGGIVDYVLGAKPSPGVFLLATIEDPKHRHLLNLYKLGEGPLYNFYTPYHLCHFEAPFGVARAVLFGDAVITPKHGPCVDVIATVKKPLTAGDTLDGIGGYTAYGQCENHSTTVAQDLLPLGLAEGCRLARDVSRDELLTFSSVILPAGRVCDRLYEEQRQYFDVSAGIAMDGVTTHACA
jgi:predicted homoserine dehydrogenase-like protein